MRGDGIERQAVGVRIGGDELDLVPPRARGHRAAEYFPDLIHGGCRRKEEAARSGWRGFRLDRKHDGPTLPKPRGEPAGESPAPQIGSDHDQCVECVRRFGVERVQRRLEDAGRIGQPLGGEQRFVVGEDRREIECRRAAVDAGPQLSRRDARGTQLLRGIMRGAAKAQPAGECREPRRDFPRFDGARQRPIGERGDLDIARRFGSAALRAAPARGPPPRS